MDLTLPDSDAVSIEYQADKPQWFAICTNCFGLPAAVDKTNSSFSPDELGLCVSRIAATIRVSTRTLLLLSSSVRSSAEINRSQNAQGKEAPQH